MHLAHTAKVLKCKKGTNVKNNTHLINDLINKQLYFFNNKNK